MAIENLRLEIKHTLVNYHKEMKEAELLYSIRYNKVENQSRGIETFEWIREGAYRGL